MQCKVEEFPLAEGEKLYTNCTVGGQFMFTLKMAELHALDL